MSIFKKVLTGLRGSVREIGEAVVDANASRIYEQEIVDAKQHLTQAKSDLTLVMAKEMQAQREIARLQAEIERYELHAVDAMNQDKMDLAEEVAQHIVGLENALSEQQHTQAQFSAQISQLKQLIHQAEAKLREHERELVIAKTTESVYKATQSISASMGSGVGKLANAKESLDRIKQRHTDLSDRMKAQQELDEETSPQRLEQKLHAAGIGETALHKDTVMARLRAKQATQATVADEPQKGALDA